MPILGTITRKTVKIMVFALNLRYDFIFLYYYPELYQAVFKFFFFFSSRRRHTRWLNVTEFRRVLFRSDRKSTRLNSSHIEPSRMPSSASLRLISKAPTES